MFCNVCIKNSKQQYHYAMFSLNHAEDSGQMSFITIRGGKMIYYITINVRKRESAMFIVITF